MVRYAATNVATKFNFTKPRLKKYKNILFFNVLKNWHFFTPLIIRGQDIFLNSQKPFSPIQLNYRPGLIRTTTYELQKTQCLHRLVSIFSRYHCLFHDHRRYGESMGLWRVYHCCLQA